MKHNPVMRTLVATRLRAAMTAGIVLCLVALGWYLGSPLFIRTTLEEAAPAAAPAATASAARGAVSPVVETPPASTRTGQLQYVDGLHNGTGEVLLLRTADGIVLRFAGVQITNAPDVHVYLSRETGGQWSEATSLYVGPLKATNGSFNYPVPTTDVSGYKSVVVWCRQFSVLVTWADLSG